MNATQISMQWAEQWPHKAFEIDGYNIAKSLYRHSVYAFLSILKLDAVNIKYLYPEEQKRGIKQLIKKIISRLVRTGSNKPTILVSASYKNIATVLQPLRNMGYRILYLRPVFDMSSACKGLISRVYENYDKQEVRRIHQNMMSSQWWKPQLFQCEGRSYAKIIKPQLNYYVRECFPLLIGYALLCKNLFSRENIKGILVDEDVCEFNRTLIGVASVPSVVVQHGQTYPSNPLAYTPVSATKIAVWGQYAKKVLLECGVAQDKIEITGSPRHG